MVNWSLDGSVSSSAMPDADGHFMRVLKDGKKVFGGTWADCEEYVITNGNNDDNYSDHTDGARFDVKVAVLIQERRETAINYGIATDEKGNILHMPVPDLII